MNEPVLIIGGGPAGLSLAWELQRRGVSARVLEAGPVAGASWARMPEHMKLLSPWFQNVLFDRRTPLSERFSLKPAQDFAEYLRTSAGKHGLQIETGAAVQRVLAAGDGFEVLTDAGPRQARLLVNATGYFAKPWMPDFAGMESTAIPLVHFHDFQNAVGLVERFRLKGLRALVVGSRVSGGQLVEELYDAGFLVTIGCRETLRFSRPPWMQAATFPFYFAVEEWIAQRNPLALPDTAPPMQAGRVPAWVRRGEVKVRSGITCFEEKSVRFADGTEDGFDIALFATGFRPALDHFSPLLPLDTNGMPRLQGMQSADLPGLYFLGLDKQRSFRSRYLRGIRDDAAVLAAQLQSSLASAPCCAVH